MAQPNRRDSVEGIGWEHLHVAVDDASRLAYTELLANEQKEKRDRIPRSRPRLVRQPRRVDQRLAG